MGFPLALFRGAGLFHLGLHHPNSGSHVWLITRVTCETLKPILGSCSRDSDLVGFWCGLHVGFFFIKASGDSNVHLSLSITSASWRPLLLTLQVGKKQRELCLLLRKPQSMAGGHCLCFIFHCREKLLLSPWMEGRL